MFTKQSFYFESIFVWNFLSSIFLKDMKITSIIVRIFLIIVFIGIYNRYLAEIAPSIFLIVGILIDNGIRVLLKIVLK